MTKGQRRELELLTQGPQPAYVGHQNRARAGVQNRLALDFKFARYMPKATAAETVEITDAGRVALAEEKGNRIPMSYPKNPTTLEEAAVTLADFAKTAPGRLPERVKIAIRIATEHQKTQSGAAKTDEG